MSHRQLYLSKAIPAFSLSSTRANGTRYRDTVPCTLEAYIGRIWLYCTVKKKKVNVLKKISTTCILNSRELLFASRKKNPDQSPKKLVVERCNRKRQQLSTSNWQIEQQQQFTPSSCKEREREMGVSPNGYGGSPEVMLRLRCRWGNRTHAYTYICILLEIERERGL